MTEKVLVTGAAGFIGSHLVELLVEEGYSVVAFDRYNSESNWGWLEGSEYKENFEFILGDIRDFDSVNRALTGCSSVFHLAALIGIPYSYLSPLAYVRTNIEGTYNILESSRNNDLDQVIITSTSETYGSAQYVPIDEDHPAVGQSPYSASKIGADSLAMSYHLSFNSPVKIVRPFNTYGPRQSARAIIPTIISQVMASKKEIKLGSLTPTRDLTFVKDTCKGFLEIYKSKTLYGQATNIGMQEEITIEDLSNLIFKLMNAEVQIISEEKRVRPENSEVDRLNCSNEKLIRETSWLPEYDLEKGLEETIQWFEKSQKDYKTDFYHV
jgi:NAD dependent epimerase/dehydratase